MTGITQTQVEVGSISITVKKGDSKTTFPISKKAEMLLADVLNDLKADERNEKMPEDISDEILIAQVLDQLLRMYILQNTKI